MSILTSESKFDLSPAHIYEHYHCEMALKDRIKKALRYAYIYDIIGAAIVTCIILIIGSSLVKLTTGSSKEVVLHIASISSINKNPTDKESGTNRSII